VVMPNWMMSIPFCPGGFHYESRDTILSLQLQEEEALKEFATLSGFLCMCAGEIPRPGDFIMSRGWCFEIVNADDKRILLVRVEHLVGTHDEEGEDGENENPIRKMLRLKLNNNNNEQDDGDNHNISSNSDMTTLEMSDEESLVDGTNGDSSSDNMTNGGAGITDEEVIMEDIATTTTSGATDSVADATLELAVEDQLDEIAKLNKAEARDVERMVESGERKRELLELIREEQQNADNER